VTRLDELYRMRTRIAAEIDYYERAGLTRTEHVIQSAANLYGVTAEAVLSPSRDAQDVRARQAACWLLRARGLTLPAIGRALGRDHTTVLYACNKIDADPARRALLYALLTREESAA
jgi:chromosomal replication initiation ATPase DnaA